MSAPALSLWVCSRFHAHATKPPKGTVCGQCSGPLHRVAFTARGACDELNSLRFRLAELESEVLRLARATQETGAVQLRPVACGGAAS